MKRFAVFESIQYYPSGGMSDFVSAFISREEANAFVESRPDLGCLYVEDMETFLTKDSLPSWTLEQRLEYFAAKRKAHEESMNNPIYRAMHGLSLRFQKDMYGDGT